MSRWRLALVPGNWPAAAMLGLARVVVLLPHGLLMRLGGAIGGLAGRVLKDRRLTAQINISACFPKWPAARQEQLVEETLADSGRGLLEAAMSLWWRDQRLEKRLVVSGLEHWTAAREGGTLVLSAHVTMAELVVRLVNLACDEPVSVIARHNAQPLVQSVIDDARRRYCSQVLEKKDTRGLLRLLRGGGAVLYGPDQDFSFNSVFADFFSVPAATLKTTAELAERTGCTVLPAWCRRDAQGRYHLQFFPPLTDFPSGDPVIDATTVNHWIETQVRKSPSQYLWIHRRFKTRPPGEPPFYPPAARRPKHRGDSA